MSLVVCSGCARHRKTDAPSCPFCGATVVDVEPRRPARASATRAALVFGGVVLSVGCVTKGDVYGAPPPPAPDAGAPPQSHAPIYGAPPKTRSDAAFGPPSTAPVDAAATVGPPAPSR